MGKKERDKGYRGEYTLVKMLKEEGLRAVRVPLSGGTSFYKGDIVCEGLTGEVKLRADGFARLYQWLGDLDFLAVKADYEKYLIVVPIDRFVKLLKKAREGE